MSTAAEGLTEANNYFANGANANESRRGVKMVLSFFVNIHRTATMVAFYICP